MIKIENYEEELKEFIETTRMELDNLLSESYCEDYNIYSEDVNEFLKTFCSEHLDEVINSDYDNQLDVISEHIDDLKSFIDNEYPDADIYDKEYHEPIDPHEYSGVSERDFF